MDQVPFGQLPRGRGKHNEVNKKEEATIEGKNKQLNPQV